MLNLFITGSDINVGKTFVAAGLAATMQSLGYSTCVYKPIQTGAMEKNGFAQSPDLVYVKTIDPYIKTYSSYLLKDSGIPVIAAEAENISIDKNYIRRDYDSISAEHECVIAEGTGGIATPIAAGLLVSDLVKTLDAPVLVVVNPSICAVNQALLTINHASEKGLNVRGVIINNISSDESNEVFRTLPRLIEEYSDAKILGIIRYFENSKKLNPSDLITEILNGVDIESVFNVKISKLEVE